MNSLEKRKGRMEKREEAKEKLQMSIRYIENEENWRIIDICLVR